MIKKREIGPIFNLVAGILGAGVLGMPHALKSAGFTFGIFLLFVVAGLTFWSIDVLIRLAEKHDCKSYQSLCKKAFGERGHQIMTVILFVNGFGAMVSYLIVVGDVFPSVIQEIAGEDAWIAKRNVCLFFLATFVALPLCFFREIQSLEKTSAMSVITITLVCIATIKQLITILHEPGQSNPGSFNQKEGLSQSSRPHWTHDPSSLLRLGVDISSALGVFAFAFVCHQYSFIIYNSITKDISGISTSVRRTKAQHSLGPRSKSYNYTPPSHSHNCEKGGKGQSHDVSMDNFSDLTQAKSTPTRESVIPCIGMGIVVESPIKLAEKTQSTQPTMSTNTNVNKISIERDTKPIDSTSDAKFFSKTCFQENPLANSAPSTFGHLHIKSLSDYDPISLDSAHFAPISNPNYLHSVTKKSEWDTESHRTRLPSLGTEVSHALLTQLQQFECLMSWRRVAMASISIAFFISITATSTGYLANGLDTKENILNNFSSENAFFQAVKLLVGIQIFLTYPLEFFVVRGILYKGILSYWQTSKSKTKKTRKVLRNSTQLDNLAHPLLETDDHSARETALENDFGQPSINLRFRQFFSKISHIEFFSHIIATLLLWSCVLLVAMSTSDLEYVFSLTGGICATVLAFLAPSLCFLRLGIDSSHQTDSLESIRWKSSRTAQDENPYMTETESTLQKTDVAQPLRLTPVLSPTPSINVPSLLLKQTESHSHHHSCSQSNSALLRSSSSALQSSPIVPPDDSFAHFASALLADEELCGPTPQPCTPSSKSLLSSSLTSTTFKTQPTLVDVTQTHKNKKHSKSQMRLSQSHPDVEEKHFDSSYRASDQFHTSTISLSLDHPSAEKIPSECSASQISRESSSSILPTSERIGCIGCLVSSFSWPGATNNADTIIAILACLIGGIGFAATIHSTLIDILQA